MLRLWRERGRREGCGMRIARRDEKERKGRKEEGRSNYPGVCTKRKKSHFALPTFFLSFVLSCALSRSASPCASTWWCSRCNPRQERAEQADGRVDRFMEGAAWRTESPRSACSLCTDPANGHFAHPCLLRLARSAPRVHFAVAETPVFPACHRPSCHSGSCRPPRPSPLNNNPNVFVKQLPASQRGGTVVHVLTAPVYFLSY